METTKYSVERPLVLWDDKTGDRLEIGPDRDCLDMVEIRHYDNKGTIGPRITMTKEQWRLLAEHYTP